MIPGMLASEMSLRNSLKESRIKNDFYLMIYCLSHFIEEETEGQKCQLNCPRSHSSQGQNQDSEADTPSHVPNSFLHTRVVSGRLSQAGLGVSLF